MRDRLLGRSGARVSDLCLGTMGFGTDWGWGASREESRKIFDAFAEAGGNFLDTANRYTNGTSETMVGEFCASDRDLLPMACALDAASAIELGFPHDFLSSDVIKGILHGGTQNSIHNHRMQ